MTDEKILYEYKYDETKNIVPTISYSRNTIKVFEQKGYDYTTKKEILKHILKLDTNEPAGIIIRCDKHYVSIGSMSFSLTCTDFKTVIISEVDEKYISTDLEFK